MKLREYQLKIAADAVGILRQRGIVYLAMQVRTGKTLTALAIADEIGATSVLFCTRKKAMSSIESDYEALRPRFEFDLINYESLHKLSLDDVMSYDLVICDEAHCLGAFPKPSERTKMLQKIVGRKYLVLLSGTPSPESYSQLFHQFWIHERTPWKAYKNFYQWAKEYVSIRKKYMYNREIQDYSHAIIDKVSKDIEPFVISYTQEEAGFVSPVQEKVITVKMKDATYAAAKILTSKRVLKTSEGMAIADTELKLMQKLHQIFSGTIILDEPVFNHAKGLWEDPKSQIFDLTKAEHIRDAFDGWKIAIFYKFKAELLALTAVFGKRICFFPDEFNESDSYTVFVSQVQSGREGINLSSADALIMYNIDFSAVSYWQARARLQSKDRVKDAEVYWVFAEGGIEQKIYDVVQGKKDYTLNHFRKDFKI